MNSSYPYRKALRALGTGVLGAFAAAAIAQTPLEQLAANSSAQYEIEYSRAVAMAMLNGIPTEISDGIHKMKLVGMRGTSPLYLQTEDLNADKTISADKVWPGGVTGVDLNGAPVLIGIWDDGTINHAEFTGRVTAGETAGGASHGNFVACMAAASGVNPAAKGAAFAARLLSYNAFNDDDIAEMALEAQNGLRVSNHSYGLISGWIFGILGDGKWAWLGDPAISATTDYRMGQYGQGAAEYDNLAFNAPFYLPVFSAGNQRLEGPDTQPVDHNVFVNGAWTNSMDVRDLDGGPLGYDCLGPEKTTKNCLIVGATTVNANGYQGPNSVTMSSFSCFGPTDDGRVKPDLVTPGQNVFGTFGGGYTFSDGTSFSSPLATGGLALMLERYLAVKGTTPRASTLHGLAIHTCDEAGPNDGPDYKFGWGQMNVNSAVNLISQSAFNTDWIQEVNLQNGQTIDIQVPVAAGGAFKATICWHEPAGTPGPNQLNNRTPALINDLDLRVIEPGGGIAMPWKLDPANPAAAATTGDNLVDNVEVVEIPSPTTGLHTIRISHKGTNLRPGGSQIVSVIFSGQISGGLESLTLDPTTVVGGLQNSFATARLSQSRTEDTVLQVTSSNPTAASVPSSITIPAGQLSASFDVFTSAVSGTTTANILVGGTVGTASARLTLRPVGLANPLTLWPGRVPSGNYVTGYVNLNGPAPAGGASVNLSSTDPFYAEPTRNWVLVPEGQTQLRFSVFTRPVTQSRVVYIRASRAGVTIQNDITLLPATVKSLSTSVNTAHANDIVRGTVTLDAPAPNTGTVVSLSSSNTSRARVPSTVLVPPGYRTADFNITTQAVTSAGNVTITATRSGTSVSKTITVIP